ncbi:hypothetical protein CUJ83_05380 [Methanocella sp. CWC-04]|uniref:Uncharacterized protein n=1 Tax=Methanooceanicella nereidis TaxID=2052831 RepID=A0AAP2RE80_9EURY|nr:hypothetical protein [Methanocella sp. CWC-04]MCD1294430.1 hypothetical protein [Methanocella sp. CWC-04]
MYSTTKELSRYRDLIIRDAVNRFRGAAYFAGKGQPPEDIAHAVCEGLMDLLMEPSQARDVATVRRYMEWLYNLIRKEGKKTDTTIRFLDEFEEIITRRLDNKQDAEVDVFFEICREIVENKHKQLIGKP